MFMPEIGKLYKLKGNCFEFMAKLVDIDEDPLTEYHFDNGVIVDLSERTKWTEIQTWYYWDTNREITIMEGDKLENTLPFSVLCNDCGSMLRALTEREVNTLELPHEIDGECIECGGDSSQTISAQFSELAAKPQE
jgi:hypothetical protein